ncbi:MAG: redoxin domain-containing protein [Bacteroidales bacterium]
MKKNLFLILVCALSVWTANAAKSYKIEVQFKGLSNTTVQLGYFVAEQNFIIDTVRLNKSGKGLFSKNFTLPRGSYFVLLPNRNYVEFLISDKQSFKIKADYKDVRETLEFVGSPENQAFTQYQSVMRTHIETSTNIRKQMQYNARHTKDSTKFFQEQIQQNELQVNRYIDGLANTYRNGFLGTILNANRIPAIPNIRHIKSEATKDSIRTAYFSRYFDRVNITDEGLIRTKFFTPSLDFFFKQLIPQQPDTIIRHADRLIKRSESNPAMFRHLVDYFLQAYQISENINNEPIFMHLADKYYLTERATWVSKEAKEKLRETVEKFRLIVVGAIAPDFRMMTSENKRISLHETPSDWTFLVFFDPNHPQCQKELKELWQFYNANQQKGVQVIAMYTLYKRNEWQAFLDLNQYTWINTWDGLEGKDANGNNTIYSMGSNYYTTYNVKRAPTIYLLDKNKKIVARNLSVNELSGIVTNSLRK